MIEIIGYIVGIYAVTRLVVTAVEAHDSDKKVANIAVVIFVPCLMILGLMIVMLLSNVPTTP